MFPIICIEVTTENKNQTETLLVSLELAALTEANAKISIAMERYIAHAVGFPRSYQLTTCEMDIMTTSKIGRRNEFLTHTPFSIFLILSKNLLINLRSKFFYFIVVPNNNIIRTLSRSNDRIVVIQHSF